VASRAGGSRSTSPVDASRAAARDKHTLRQPADKYPLRRRTRVAYAEDGEDDDGSPRLGDSDDADDAGGDEAAEVSPPGLEVRPCVPSLKARRSDACCG
jgi:hypothetical protein